MIRQCLQKKAKKAIQANTELILKLKPRKSFSEKNISFIHKSKHRTCNLKKDIANWFAMSDITYDNKVEFRPLVDVFTQGYISMENYVSTIPDKNFTLLQQALHCQQT